MAIRLLMTGTNHATSPAVLPKVPYDTQKDFAAITLVAEGPHVLVVGAQSPFNSVKDVVAAAKARPKDITYSSSGRGGTVHFAGAMFEEAAGVELTHVPYKGAAPAVQDLVGGPSPDVLRYPGVGELAGPVGAVEVARNCGAGSRGGVWFGTDLRRGWAIPPSRSRRGPDFWRLPRRHVPYSKSSRHRYSRSSRCLT